ncbi:hypothetical protein THRCLA_01034 [Thraustotheca clavata]|uniref:Uncharacterized protein n=1 Tax=Thraustotheca clavata TaxID=74557 RepID=A0A1W0A9F8_9STRA|nr:hypothetical protein THRCLA_01034 [Thraustotheca clavata]
MDRLCCGDLVLVVAQGMDIEWSHESSLDPHPAIGFLSSCEQVGKIEGIVHRTTCVENLETADVIEPKSVLSCVFRIEAVLNKEDIVRVDLQRKLDNHTLEQELSCQEYGTEIKFGQCIQLVHQHTNQILRINVNERGPAAFTMKVGLEFQKKFVTSCNVAAREQWLDSWFEVEAPVKNKGDGDIVHIEDVVHFYSHRWQRYLGAIQGNNFMEVVVGAAETRWQLVPFAKHDAQPTLKGGDVLRFIHMESESNLTLCNNELALSADKSSNALWAIEPLNAKWGGKQVESNAVQLRHVASGQLLGIEQKSTLHPSCIKGEDLKTTLFRFVWTGKSTFHIQHAETRYWLCGEIDSAPMPLRCCRTVRDSDVFGFEFPSSQEVSVLLDMLFTKRRFALYCLSILTRSNLTALTFQDFQPLEMCLKIVRASLNSKVKFIFWDQDIVSSLLESFKDLATKNRPELRTCLRELCALIEEFVTNDPKSQETLHPYLSTLQDLLSSSEAVAKALTACVRDNRSFLEELSSKQMQHIVDRMGQPAVYDWAFEYLRNQCIVLEGLLNNDVLPIFQHNIEKQVQVLIPHKPGLWRPLSNTLDEPSQLYVAHSFYLLAKLYQNRKDAKTNTAFQFIADNALGLLDDETIPGRIRAGLCDFMTFYKVQSYAHCLYHDCDFSSVSFTRSWQQPYKSMYTQRVDSATALTWEECMDAISPYDGLINLVSNNIDTANSEKCCSELILSVLQLCEICIGLGFYQAPKQLTTIVHLLAAYLRNDGSSVKIKVQVCHILSKLDIGHLNNQISSLVMFARTHSSEVTTRQLLEDAFDQVVVQDDCYADINYVDILCSLCRHECNELTMLSLGLLYAYFNTIPEMRQVCDKLLLLSNDEWEITYDKLKKIASDINHDEAQLQIILDLVSAQPLDEYQQMQRILFHVGLHKKIINMLEHAQSQIGGECVRKCYQILMHMIGCDRSFESLLVRHLELFLHDLPFYPSEVSHFIRSVLLHNESLVQTIPASQIVRIANMLATTSFMEAPSARTRLLEVLLHLVVTKKVEYIESNQNLVFNALSAHHLDLFSGEIGYTNRLELMALVDKTFEMVLVASTHRVENFLKNHYAAAELHGLHYHGQLLQLLSACAQGKNHRVEVECRSLLSIDEIIRALLDSRTIFSVRKALMSFLDAAYFEVQIPVIVLVENPLVWSLLEYVVQDLTCILQMDEANFFGEFENLKTTSEPTLETMTSQAHVFQAILNFIDDIVLPMLSNFYCHLAATITSPHLIRTQVTISIFTVLTKVLEIQNLPEKIKFSITMLVTTIQDNSVLLRQNAFQATKLTTGATSFSRLVHHKQLTILTLKAWQGESKRRCLWRKLKKETPRICTLSKPLSLTKTKKSSFRNRYRSEVPTIDHIAVNPMEEFIPAQMRSILFGFESTDLYSKTILERETAFIEAFLSPSMDEIVSHVIAYICQHDKGNATNAHEQPHVHLNILGWLLDGNDNELYIQQTRLSRLGGSAMVLKLIGKAIQDVHVYPLLLQETLQVGLAMLRNGNKVVQEAMFEHVQALGESFVSGIVHFLRLPAKQDLYDMVINLLEFLRLLCENHFTPMQLYVRQQSNKSHDIIEEVIGYLCGFLWVVDPRTHTLVWNVVSDFHLSVVLQLLATLTEFVQGCESNQRSVGRSTKLIHAINGILRHQYPFHLSLTWDSEIPLVYENCSVSQVQKLKQNAVLLIYSLLEGNHDTEVANHILLHIDSNTWSAHCLDIKRELDTYRALKERQKLQQDTMISVTPSPTAIDAKSTDAAMQERLLLQTIDMNNTLQDKVVSHWTMCSDLLIVFHTLFELSGGESDTQAKIKFSAEDFFSWTELQSGMGSIEIVRNDKLETINFRIPNICIEHWEHRVIRDSRERMVYMFTKDSQISKLDNFHRYSILLLEELQYCALLKAHSSPFMRLVLQAEDPTMNMY